MELCTLRFVQPAACWAGRFYVASAYDATVPSVVACWLLDDGSPLNPAAAIGLCLSVFSTQHIVGLVALQVALLLLWWAEVTPGVRTRPQLFCFGCEEIYLLPKSEETRYLVLCSEALFTKLL